MDITILFKACVKTVRTTNKALGVNEVKTNTLLTTAKDANLAKAKEIVKHVTHLHQFFLENRAAYLNVLNYLSTNKTMTEVDRESIDTISQNTISMCSMMISDYNKNMLKQITSRQKRKHYQNVIESVEAYLKIVSKLYIEAKAIRVKKVIETHKLSKLENISSPRSSHTRIISDNSAERDVKKSYPNEIVPPQTPTIENITNELSPEEIQMFESENEHLYSELNSLSDEVKQIENKVVHIAELQDIFTEKVLQQEKDIERIATTVAGTTDDVKLANEQIKQAIQRNAGLRVWILFFLLVMSFSLLFLDWYND